MGAAPAPEVAEALEQLKVLVEGDGARFDWVPDEDAAVVRLRLDLSQVECLDCVLPPEMLLDVVTTSVRKTAGNAGLSVVIDDPRSSDVDG